MDGIEQFTMEVLRTPVGIGFAAWLLTQTLKDLPGVKAIRTQYLCLLLTWGIMVAVAAIDGTLTVPAGFLILLNGTLYSFGTSFSHDEIAVKRGWVDPPR